MVEYIEREALAKDVMESKNFNRHVDPVAIRTHRHEHEHFLKMIGCQPAADAVHVVRCKDCKFAEIFENESYCLCLRKMAGKIRPDDFCSYGERKDGE